MNTTKYRFAFISHSAELAAAVRNCSNPDTEDIIISEANMEGAIPVAQKLIQEGVEVILSGWGTAGLLMREIGQQVVKIARTDLDIILALLKAREKATEIGLTTFGSPLPYLGSIEKLLSIKIKNIVFNSTPELLEGVSAAYAQGVRVVVGGGICKRIIDSIGGEGVLVLPTDDAVRQALQEARDLASTRRREKEEMSQFRTVLETIKEGVIVFDGEGSIKLCNRVAADIMGVRVQDCQGRKIPEIADAVGVMNVLDSRTPETDKIRHIGAMDVVVNSTPIMTNGDMKGVVTVLKEAQRIQSIERKLREKFHAHGFVAKYTIDHFKTKSDRMEDLIDRARKYALTDVSVLIEGETGTGKEVLSQSIHNLSERSGQVFIAINCSALPESLLESELFGYDEGAFTGAKKGGKPGLFELAHRGTIFLDEIADISPALQVKLLRVLEEKEVMRIGGDQIIPVDVRIVSSTYKDLRREIREGRFRPDLYYRLAALTLMIPPLRERPEDIPVLVDEYLHKYGKGAKKMPKKLMKALKDYSWPGNIRELDSLIKRYVILLGAREYDDVLLVALLDELRIGYRSEERAAAEVESLEFSDVSHDTLKNLIRDFEGRVIEKMLKDTRFSKKEAARRLGISFNTLWRKMNHYHRK